MTEIDLVFLLRQGKTAWDERREANPSPHPGLHEANLSGANLSGALLRAADLSSHRIMLGEVDLCVGWG